MDRLTKNIEDWKIYTLSSAYISEIPDVIYGNKYTGTAINKLGQLEDVFEIIEKMYKYPVCFKLDSGEVVKFYYNDSTILYNPKDNSIYIYEYSFIDSYNIDDYGKEWWIEEEEK